MPNLATPLPPPRLGDRSLFPDLEARAYLAHAGVSPPSLAVRAAAARVLDRYARGGTGAVAETLALRARLKEKLARLVGARPADLALTSGTSAGVTAIALSLPWRSGDRVILFRGEFPANVTPWQRAAALFGLEPVFLEAADFEADAAEGLERLEDELARGARLVAVSAVQFQTGLAMPLREMATLCTRHGAELFVDAIQVCGVAPVDVGALGVDYLACGAHKWLMGIEGAGFLYVRPERAAALRPHLAGWLSHEEPVSFLTDGPGHLRYDRPIRRRPDFLEGGSMSTACQAALDAAVEALLELGIPAVQGHVQRYLDVLEPRLLERGFTGGRTPVAARRSGILSVRPPPGRDVRALRDGLHARGVAVSIPDGWLRFAPHWPNALAEVEHVIEALDGIG